MSRGGAEYRLTHGELTAVVTEVGAGVRLLRHGARDLVLPYDAGEVRPRYRGVLLAPWPNRVVDGRYTFENQEYQLPLTEPERGHALHGLVSWSRFERVAGDGTSVTLTHRLVPTTGYPFEVEVRASYSLDDSGLTCVVTAVNRGDHPAPYGVGSHPYLVAGAGPVDRWSLELPAERVLEVTEPRLVPTRLAPVAGSNFDFREERSLDGVFLDHAFTDLRPAEDGSVRARVRSTDGSGVVCTWQASDLPWVQVHTADLPPPEHSRAGLALEPMSCAPDAFNSGAGLLVLGPGEQVSHAWTIGPA